jgi:hypothetical protein
MPRDSSTRPTLRLCLASPSKCLSQSLSHVPMSLMFTVVVLKRFMEACKRLVANNLEFVPPYAPNGQAGSFYIRPLLFGSGANLALAPAPEFTFLVYGSPVGSLYSTCPFARMRTNVNHLTGSINSRRERGACC